ncbi:DUF2130 domain-containing protein [Mycoplasma sp. 4423]
MQVKSKKINIKIKDIQNLEFFIDDINVSDGDYFNLNDILNQDLKKITDETGKIREQIIQNEKNRLTKEIQENLEKTFTREIKNSKEYNELKSEKDYEINKLIIENVEKTQKLENELKDNYYKQLEHERNKLKDKFEAEKKDYENSILNKEIENIKLKFQQEHQKQLMELENELKILNIEKQSLLEKNEKLLAEFEEKKQLSTKLQTELETLQKYRYNKSTKEYGEEFENHIFNKLAEGFAFSEDVSFEKTTKHINNRKPDFKIDFKDLNILDDDKNSYGTIIIEAKNRITEQGSKRNKDFIEKLEQDRKNFKADFAILVTELEPNSVIYIEKISGYNEIFIVRDVALINLVLLLKNILQIKYSLNADKIEFNSKKIILEKFNDFVEKNILNHIEKSNKEIEGIIENADKMRKLLSSIEDSANNIAHKHFSKMQRKISDFGKSEFIKEISKLEKVEQKLIEKKDSE